MMLLWCGGHSWSVNGHSRYAESSLIVFNRLRSNSVGAYKHLGRDGGRLTLKRVEPHRDALGIMFGAEYVEAILEAVTLKQTAIIEGG